MKQTAISVNEKQGAKIIIIDGRRSKRECMGNDFGRLLYISFGKTEEKVWFLCMEYGQQNLEREAFW